MKPLNFLFHDCSTGDPATGWPRCRCRLWNTRHGPSSPWLDRRSRLTYGFGELDLRPSGLHLELGLIGCPSGLILSLPFDSP